MSNFKKWMNGEYDPLNKELSPYETNQEMKEQIEENALLSIEEVNIIKEKEEKHFNLFNLVLSIITFVTYIVILVFMASHLQTFGKTNTAWNYVARYYIDFGLKQTKSVNSITGMILDYRAFDTLGESFVLFSAVTCVFVLLLGLDDENKYRKHGFLAYNDPIVRLIGGILIPIIFMFGIYIVVNGHLSPGGGFSGGAIMGAGLILFSLAFGGNTIIKFFNLKTFKTISSIALLGYAFTKCYSFLMGGLEIHDPISSWFNSLPDGSILSGGYILILNICVGLVVACTMYGFYSMFRKGEF